MLRITFWGLAFSQCKVPLMNIEFQLGCHFDPFNSVSAIDLLTNKSKLDLSQSEIQFKLLIWQQMWGEGEQIATLYSCSRTRVTKILEISNPVFKNIYQESPKKVTDSDVVQLQQDTCDQNPRNIRPCFQKYTSRNPEKKSQIICKI